MSKDNEEYWKKMVRDLPTLDEEATQEVRSRAHTLMGEKGIPYLTDETAWQMFPGAFELYDKAMEKQRKREEMEQRDFMEWLKGEPEEESGCE